MRALFVSLIVTVVPAAASAQVCPYGLVAVDAAHCCWPGQTFAPDRGVCAGVPQCPPGLAPYGETCVAASAAQPAPSPEGPPMPPPPPPPPSSAMPPPQMPMQAMPQIYGYPVRFEAKRAGNEFTVSVDDGMTCRTPCELMVQPGRHKVRVEGDARFVDRLRFPAGPSTVQIEKRRGGGVALGVVGLSVGIPAAVVGGVYGFVGLLANTYGGSSGAREMMYGGFGVMAAGVTLVAVGAGVGFGIAGHNRARLVSEAGEPEAPPVQMLSLGVVPTNGGAMAGAAFAF